MKRRKRTDNEIRQFGLPTLEERVIGLEEMVIEQGKIIEKLLKGASGIPAARRKNFDGLQSKMDDIDIKHPGKIQGRSK